MKAYTFDNPVDIVILAFLMAPETPDLAIVIPAYRLRHLGEALDSIANQTDRRFRVYIGDDASCEPIEMLARDFAGRIDIQYKRFETNLGRSNLVSHWRRCVALTETESWIWLFSDDDLMESQCVARFYEMAARHSESSVDLFRFQLDYIDENSRRISRRPEHPDFESLNAFLSALLENKYRAWRAQDHIFSRAVYERAGGFVDFPKAIYSDHATWVAFAAEKGVRTIRGPRVLWRSHPQGTSSGMRETHRTQWQLAARLYVEWLSKFSFERGESTAMIFQKRGRKFYFRELSRFRPMLTFAERRSAISSAQQIFRCSWISASLALHCALFRHRFTRWRRSMSPRWFRRLLRNGRLLMTVRVNT